MLPPSTFYTHSPINTKQPHLSQLPPPKSMCNPKLHCPSRHTVYLLPGSMLKQKCKTQLYAVTKTILNPNYKNERVYGWPTPDHQGGCPKKISQNKKRPDPKTNMTWGCSVKDQTPDRLASGCLPKGMMSLGQETPLGDDELQECVSTSW